MPTARRADADADPWVPGRFGTACKFGKGCWKPECKFTHKRSWLQVSAKPDAPTHVRPAPEDAPACAQAKRERAQLQRAQQAEAKRDVLDAERGAWNRSGSRRSRSRSPRP